MASHYALLPKLVGSEAKSFIYEVFSAAFYSSFNVKMPSGTDKTVATAACMLLSLAAATLADTSCIPSSSRSVQKGCLE